MIRVVTTSLVTAFSGLLILAVAAAVSGYLYGAGSRLQYRPGLEGAVLNTIIFTGFCGPTVWVLGAVAGAVAGLVGLAVDRLRGKR
jgi:hypothetical protein